MIQLVRKVNQKSVRNFKLLTFFPAMFFETNAFTGFEPLSKTDAAYVQVIHTNGGILGMQGQVGTADFYPNGGIRQPGKIVRNFNMRNLNFITKQDVTLIR